MEQKKSRKYVSASSTFERNIFFHIFHLLNGRERHHMGMRGGMEELTAIAVCYLCPMFTLEWNFMGH
jgi:hypothetical protein